MRVEKTGLPDAVVWNPWSETAGKMADMGVGEWTRMVCVEPAVAATSAVIQAGSTWTSRMLLSRL